MRGQFIERIVTKQEPLEPLVQRTLDLDPDAWQALWLLLDPRIEAIAGRWRVTGRLSSSLDDRRNIVVRVMDRLRAHGFERLRLLHDTLHEGEEAGWAWISVVTRRDAFNYVRGHAEHLGPPEGNAGARWAVLVPLPDGVEDHLPESLRVISAIEGREILTYAEQHLRSQQLDTLRLWLGGYETEEIVARLGVADGRAAGNLLYRAIENLRYHFARRGLGGRSPHRDVRDPRGGRK